MSPLPEQETRRPPAPDEPGGSGVVVSPVVVLSRTFPARPSSIPDAHEFVRSALASANVESAPHAEITEAINSALLEAASPDIGSFVVVVRLFPEEAEVEVLSSADPAIAALSAAASAPRGGGTFADWLSDVLRNQGLSQEAAARQLGVSVRTVSRWVRGQTEPRLRDVRRIDDMFGPVPRL
ncbi:MAG: family transcriptional regulator [Pseudonocardiales bacterium]|nr:family transcriptional regulator [Pseudonocardiales bacterium]